MDLGLRGKAAIVTGASRGIGRAIAQALAAEGADVLAVARSEAPLRELAASVGRAGRARLVACIADLREPEAVTRTVAAAEREFGRLDILVNNAGTTKRGEFFGLSEADWQEGFALKFFGYVRLTRAAWPLLTRASGTVVNIIGVGGRTPGAEFAIGGSVNAGLLAFTKTMAEIGIKDGVRVNAVNPGAIETERLQRTLERYAAAKGLSVEEARRRLPQDRGIERFGRVEEIADAVCFFASPRADYAQGALIDIDGGATRTI